MSEVVGSFACRRSWRGQVDADAMTGDNANSGLFLSGLGGGVQVGERAGGAQLIVVVGHGGGRGIHVGSEKTIMYSTVPHITLCARKKQRRTELPSAPADLAAQRWSWSLSEKDSTD